MKYLLNGFLLFFMIYSLTINAQSLTIYVNPASGNDSNSGTIDQPYQTISKAMSSIGSSGGTIYLRGGVYTLSATVKTSSSGMDSLNYNKLWAYPGEKPVLDFSSEPYGSSSRGLSISKNYWYIKGLEIKNAGDNGVYISGSFNIVENCLIHDNKDSGMQLSSGASYNKIINCDSYFNCDPGQGNADGFAPKLDVGTGNYFYGCRSWQNSDDGWDGYMRGADNVNTTIENCWCFMNGYLKDGSKSQGNGNGFKLGGSDDKTLMHNFTLRNCLSFDNRVKGFDQNNNKGSMELINCSGYRNGYNYKIYLPLNTGKTLLVENCLSYKGIGSDSLGGYAIQKTNSWQFAAGVSASDFISLDTTGIRGARKPDGSLPDLNFMHLSESSVLVDAGTDAGLPYNGNAPDIGAFESGATVSSIKKFSNTPELFNLKQNYPNPFNPSTIISYELSVSSHVTLKVYDITGREIATLINKEQNTGMHKIEFNIRQSTINNPLPSGIYFYRFEAGGLIETKKMLLLK